MFTVRNTILVAIMQVGVIVVGTLAAGISHKMFAGNHLLPPWPSQLLYSYGVVGFLIPMVWSIIALIVERQPNLSDDARSLAFGSGILILLSLVVFVIYADIPPWLQTAGPPDEEAYKAPFNLPHQAFHLACLHVQGRRPV